MDETFLFQKDWAALDAFFSLARHVPSEKAAFLARYGPFDDGPGVDAFLGALRDIDRASAELGGPESLKREYLSRPAPPDDIYGTIAWISGQAVEIAHGVVSTLETLPDLIDRTGDYRAQRARQTLAGNGGIADKAEGLARIIGPIADKTVSYGPRLTSSILTIQKSEIVNQANRAISEMKAEKPDLEQKAARAAQKMKAWFGADKAKEEYESLQKQIARLDAEMAKKQLLDTDLGDFFVIANRVVSSLMNAAERLKTIAKSLQDTADRIRDTFRLGSKEQLGDAAWLARALSVPQEIEHWKEFGSAAQSFVSSLPRV